MKCGWFCSHSAYCSPHFAFAFQEAPQGPLAELPRARLAVLGAASCSRALVHAVSCGCPSVFSQVSDVINIDAAKLGTCLRRHPGSFSAVETELGEMVFTLRAWPGSSRRHQLTLSLGMCEQTCFPPTAHRCFTVSLVCPGVIMSQER